jgi:hypothetical protein
MHQRGRGIRDGACVPAECVALPAFELAHEGLLNFEELRGRSSMQSKLQSILFRLSICLFAVSIAAPTIAWSQQVTASIVGQVTDPTGSPVPNAAITAKDVDRGTVYTTQTSAIGYYNLPRVPVGRYEVRAEAPGFQSSAYPVFQLDINQSARADFAMKLGQVSETVEVTSAAPLLQTETTQLGTIINSNTAENLPLASRNYVQLTLLAPGAVTPSPNGFTNGVSTGLGPGGGGSSRPYINGNHEQANNFLLDGMDNNQVSDNLTGYTPNADAIQEFNLITQNASAEYGNFQGGIINATIKSGTNQFHGDVFEFFRNDKLNANSWENNWQGNPKSKLRWNQFGGVIGGPIKRDKLFFFADYQGQRFDTPASVGPVTVFTAAERLGDFSAIKTQLVNPFKLDAKGQPTPFPGNQIPISLINPVAKNLFASSLYPKPINGDVRNNFLNTTNAAINQDQGDIKVDYNMSDKDRLMARYSRLFANDPGANSFQLFADAFTQDNAHNGLINWTHTFSPSIVNEVRGGVNYLLVNNGYDHKGVGSLGQQLGIAHANDAGPGLLALNFSNGFVSGIGNSNSGNQQLFATTVIQFDDSAVITHGRHIFHAGFQFMRDRINVYYASNSGNLGNIGFNGQYSGSGESDFFLGLPYTFGRGGSDTGTWGQRSSVIAGFVQDDFRATDTLTLNVGLRYENHTPWVEVKDRQANFDLVTGKVYMAGQSCPFDNCRALYNSHKGGLDFQPRIGFAWSPKMFGGKSVFRGAYTISSYLEGTGTNLRLPINPPIRQAETLVNYPSPDYNKGTTLLPATTVDQGLILPPPGDPFKGATLRVWDPNVQPAIVQQWSFTIQHQFSSSTTLQASYVGQHGTHLMEPLELSQNRLNKDGTISPSPYLAGNPDLYKKIHDNGGVIKGTASVGNQRYDALQTVLQKRLSGGLQAQVAYTFSKCMTDNGGYYGSWGGQATPGPTYWQNLYNQKSEWGPCFYDQKHNLTSYALYELPFGKGKKFGKDMNPIANAVVGNWNVSGILTLHPGFALTPWTWADTSGTGQFFETRKNCIAPGRVVNQPYSGGGVAWFDPSSYADPAAGTFGTCGNGVVRGPGLKNLDFSVQKEFLISENKRVQFRTDFLNFTNTPILNTPQGTGCSPDSKNPTRCTNADGLGVITSSQGGRNIQLALKFIF